MKNLAQEVSNFLEKHGLENESYVYETHHIHGINIETLTPCQKDEILYLRDCFVDLCLENNVSMEGHEECMRMDYNNVGMFIWCDLIQNLLE